MSWQVVILTPFAVVGHCVLWLSFWNRCQATGMPQWILDAMEGMSLSFFALLPFVVGWSLVSTSMPAVTLYSTIYIYSTSSLAALAATRTIHRRYRRAPEPIRGQRYVIECYDSIRRKSIEEAGTKSGWLLSLPGNQSFELELNEKEIEIPRLAAGLDGLRIAHISDLHFTGRVAREFFDCAVDRVNEMDADIVAVTGDLVDYREFMSWLPPTLGRLKARHGVYVILGNHDCKMNLSQLRLMLGEIGLISLSGRLEQIDVQGHRIVLAGNELPWISPTSDMSECPLREDVEQLRILLSHAPDQIEWAQHFDFDLMLSGHTHGGQFRIPGIGPLVCPTRLPMEYSSGVFYDSPTVLHVSRGLSGLVPLRLNCRPEITRLVLRTPVAESTSSASSKAAAFPVGKLLEHGPYMNAHSLHSESCSPARQPQVQRAVTFEPQLNQNHPNPHSRV
jgi:predicted MPP superfamily phosphohydrolase